MLSTALLCANSIILFLYTRFIDPERIAMACPCQVIKDQCCLTQALVRWLPSASSVLSLVTICQALVVINASMQESLNSEQLSLLNIVILPHLQVKVVLLAMLTGLTKIRVNCDVLHNKLLDNKKVLQSHVTCGGLRTQA